MDIMFESNRGLPDLDLAASSPNSDMFDSLLITNSWRNLNISRKSQPDSPIYFVCNYVYTPGKPSVELYAGNSKLGPVVGVVRLGTSFQESVIGVGDPALGGGRNVLWETMKRERAWSCGAYAFSWELGGMRKQYVWRADRSSFADRPSLELREARKGEDGFGIQEEAGVMDRGNPRPVLATYSVEGSKCFGGQGTFSIKRSNANISPADEEMANQWELIVLLTGLGIIEAARRAARRRSMTMSF
jgi:hypothetical protein